MGEVRLPAKAYYGAQTQRAVENFPISGRTLPPELIHALGLVKWAAATANRDLGRLGESASGYWQPVRHPPQRSADRRLAGRLPRGGRGKVRRPVPGRRLSDRLGHLQQHERQRGDRQPGDRASGGDRFSPEKPIHAERPRQSGPEHQRRLPHGHPRGRRGGDSEEADSGPRWLRRGAGPEGRRVEPDSEDRTDASGRCHAAGARPGDRRAGLAVGRVERTGRRRDRALAQLPIGGTAVGTGINTHPEFGQPRVCAVDGGDRHPPDGSRVPLRGQRPARRAGRVPRAVAHHRHHAVQRGQQHPLAGLRAPLRLLRNQAPRPPAGQLDHAGQGQSGAVRERDAGRRPGAGQRPDDHPLRRRRRAVPTQRDDARDGRCAAWKACGCWPARPTP